LQYLTIIETHFLFLVDGRNKEIDSVYVASIKNHMNQIVKEMEKHNLTPGSQQAQKYFA
jgi:hypothetical protein